MKRVLLLMTILLTNIVSEASHFAALKNSFAKIRTVSDFKLASAKKYEGFRIGGSNERLARPLDFGFKQYVFELEINYGKSYYEEYVVYLVARNDTIVLGSLQELNYHHKVKHTDNFIIKDKTISTYLKKHEATYKVKLTQKNLIAQLTELIIYGFGCSDGGGFYPKEAKRMIAYVENKNTKKLKSWLRKISPELQAYAVNGLHQLQKSGLAISNADNQIIQHIRKRNSEVYYCSGCLYGLTTTIDKIIVE